MLITEKSKMLIMTILDTLINPTTMKNVTIVIDDKHEYLSSTKTHRRKRKSDGSFDQSPGKRERIQSAPPPDGNPGTHSNPPVTSAPALNHDQALRGVESLPIQIIESEGSESKGFTDQDQSVLGLSRIPDDRVPRIGVPFPDDPYKFIPQAEKDLLESYSKKNHQVNEPTVIF